MCGKDQGPLMGQEVFEWPEFKALAVRLGITSPLPDTSLVIELPAGKPVRVTHAYYGQDLSTGRTIW